MQDRTRTTMQIAVGFTAVGFLLIALGWNGAASLDYVQGQVPFLISGGIAGLGLIGLGLMLAIVQEMRRTNAETSARLDMLTELVAAERGVDIGGPTAVPTDGTAVVAGRAVFHAPHCRLVEARPGLQAMSTPDAQQRGLVACRVCRPLTNLVG
ncbi:hypothetical protein [Egicoccus sp. AB-alg6-2]|uniref:hypothetical protein n=1 Tax=Egicoccus sp. AB-alg6-2 TaxID=3242692 RepID=UPI00359E9AD5